MTVLTLYTIVLIGLETCPKDLRGISVQTNSAKEEMCTSTYEQIEPIKQSWLTIEPGRCEIRTICYRAKDSK